jgi:DNA-binding MarR family transcriptional regulator
VELSKRCEEEGLIRRTHDAPDQRWVVLQVTPRGQQLLQALSEDHARELNELAPRLIQALARIRSNRQPDRSSLAAQESKRDINAI